MLYKSTLSESKALGRAEHRLIRTCFADVQVSQFAEVILKCLYKNENCGKALWNHLWALRTEHSSIWDCRGRRTSGKRTSEQPRTMQRRGKMKQTGGEAGEGWEAQPWKSLFTYPWPWGQMTFKHSCRHQSRGIENEICYQNASDKLKNSLPWAQLFPRALLWSDWVCRRRNCIGIQGCDPLEPNCRPSTASRHVSGHTESEMCCLRDSMPLTSWGSWRIINMSKGGFHFIAWGKMDVLFFISKFGCLKCHILVKKVSVFSSSHIVYHSFPEHNSLF